MNDNEGLTIALVFRRSRISILKLRNSEDITMPRKHFRVKVNLSKFFQDARQICWILIDTTKIQHIIHVKQHITKIFGIREPFHLLLNDTAYLPPTEDIRILFENETVKVIPGTGICNEVVCATSTILDTDNQKRFSKGKTCNNIMHSKLDQSTDNESDKIRTNISNGFNISTVTLNDTDSASPQNNATNMMYITAIDDAEEDVDSKVTNYSSLTENRKIVDSVAKKKRVRKRKSKNNNQQGGQLDDEQDVPMETLVSDAKEEFAKKPKIIDSRIISMGKHIRFNDTEDEDVCHEQLSFNDATESSMNKRAAKSLSALLALKNSSTPLTFTKKVKDNNKIEKSKTTSEIECVIMDNGSPIEVAKCTKNFNKTANNINVEMNESIKDVNKRTFSHKDLLTMELEKFTVMSRRPCVGDIIGFKTLKIAEDYTPQISDFIIAEVLNSSIDSTTYDFKIIKGAEEIEVPSGKFSVTEDETVGQDNNKVSFNISQIREPRLLTHNIF